MLLKNAGQLLIFYYLCLKERKNCELQFVYPEHFFFFNAGDKRTQTVRQQNYRVQV